MHEELHEDGQFAAMTKTKPIAELAAKVKADPVRRERIETARLATKDALALAELRTRQE